ncbi:hypothetical protein ACRCUN_23460 [Mycobacterium sp. LTG2003]
MAFPLAYSDIVRQPPGQLGPYGYQELGPGVWVPSPGTNQMHPGTFEPESSGKFVDLAEIKTTSPGELGPNGYMELGPGVWIPQPELADGSPPEIPLDLSAIRTADPGRGYTELTPGVWIPNPGNRFPPVLHNADSGDQEGGDISDKLLANSDEDAPAASHGVYEVDYSELEKFAGEHELNASQVADWAKADPDFAERYLATHGLVNYNTYLAVKGFLEQKLAAGTAFADRNAQTAYALRSTVVGTQAQDSAGAASFRPDIRA